MQGRNRAPAFFLSVEQIPTSHSVRVIRFFHPCREAKPDTPEDKSRRRLEKISRPHLPKSAHYPFLLPLS